MCLSEFRPEHRQDGSIASELPVEQEKVLKSPYSDGKAFLQEYTAKSQAITLNHKDRRKTQVR